MNRSFYKDTIANFNKANPEEIVGKMALLSGFADEVSQKNAWREQIRILKNILKKL